MLNDDDIKKLSAIFVSCKYCFYGKYKNVDPSVYKSKCIKCLMVDNNKMKIADALKTSFEPSEEYEKAVKTLIKEKEEKNK